MRDENNDTSTEPHSPGELLDELGSLKELLDEQHESVVPYTSVNEISSVEDYLQLKKQADNAGVGIEEYLNQQAEAAASSDELELLDEEGDEVPLLDEVFAFEQEPDSDGDALLLELAEEEEHTPSTAEATTVEEYFAAVAAAKHHPHAEQAEPPLLDEVIEVPPVDETIPVLDEVVSPDEAIPLLDEVVEDDAIPVLNEVTTQGDTGPEAELTLDEVQELVDLIVSRKLQQLKPELEKEVMAELQKLLPLSALTKF